MRSFRLTMLASALALIGGVLAWQFVAHTGQAQEGSFGTDTRADAQNAPQVWIEATFIQIDTGDLDKVKTGLDNSLDPLTGSVLLAGKAKAELIVALKDRPSFEVLGSASLVTTAGQQALMQMIEEVRYPTEYSSETATRETAEGKEVQAGEPVVVPGGFETREAGMRLNVMPLVGSDGRSVILVLLPEVSMPAGFTMYGSSRMFSQPIFTTWDLTTTVRINDGMTLVLTSVPTKNFEESYLLNAPQAQGLKGKKSALLLISAKIIDPGKRQ
jgi:Flp pilus assembly secretin CpaC